MYTPAHFTESNPEALRALMRDYPLGILITHGASGLDANHLPFELRADEGDHGVLQTHVARANPVWRDVSDGDEVLVVFRVADAYISPNWYASQPQSHTHVPTWNYVVAHAYGRITVHDDEAYVRGVVSRLTATHEHHRPEPWSLADAAPDYINAMVKGIVGLEIEITRLAGKSKVSQNRDEHDLRSAAEMVKAEGQRLIGEAMLARADAKARSTR